jgi:hypothetical protein
LFEAVAYGFFKKLIFQSDLAQQSFKLSHPGFQLSFPGWLRIQLAAGILPFPGIQMAGGNVIAWIPIVPKRININ